MSKTIAIKVKYSSDGEEKVIKNINELETAIDGLNQELKELDFGSEEYNRAANELKGLRSALKDVEKETEGLDIEQRLSALGGAIEVVSGSFLIASSAARTFGASAESIEEVEKLEQQALEAVNIALGVRAVSEGLVQAAQLKRVVTEKAAIVQTKIATALQSAYTAVVGTSTGALKAFRLALAATGIGLAVVAIGALIANWDKLTKAIGRSTDEQDDFNKINTEAQKNIAKTNVELDFYAGIVNDVTKSEEERATALEELNKLGVITEDIILDEADALETLNERLELNRENILLRAQAEAAASLLSEAFKEQIEAENSSLEDNISTFDSFINVFTSFGNGFVKTQQDIADGVENRQQAIDESTESVNRFETIYLQILEKLNENEAKLNSEREKADKKTKSRNKDKEKRNDVEIEYNRILEQIAKNLEDVRQQNELLATSERDQVKIIEDANKILEDQNKLLEERLGILGTSQGEAEDFADSFNRLIGGLIIPEEIVVLRDSFNEIFKIINEGEGALSAAVADGTRFGKVYGQAGTELSKFQRLLKLLEDTDPFKNITGENVENVTGLLSQLDQYGIELLSEEQKQILIDFFDTQVRIQENQDIYFETLKNTIENEELRLANEQALLFEKVTSGEMTAEEQKRQLEILQTQKDQNEERKKQINQEIDYNILLTDIVDIQDMAVKNGLSTLATQEEIISLVSKRIFDEEDITKLSKEQLELVNQTTTALLDQTKTYAQVKDINQELASLTQKINDGIEEQTKKISNSQFQQLQEFIRANNTRIDQVEKFFNELGLGSDVLKSKLKELGEEGFNAYLEEMLKSTNLTKEQFLEIQELINNLKFDTLIANISEIADKVVQEFQQITSGIQNVLSSAISLQLEQLDYYEAQILASIGDETERAREIQEETRQEIAKERFEIEKRARLQELRFSLAGAVASGAQAVLKALATVPPPGGQILAGVYGGITAAQVAVINDQINFTKGTQFIARRGGLVVGASHENGGVMANGGSIILEGGEAVLNKNAVSQFSDLLSQINISTGGRSLERDDSALVQEIRKQNQRPIKTYVLYNDIQNTNKINSRLEQISRL